MMKSTVVVISLVFFCFSCNNDSNLNTKSDSESDKLDMKLDTSKSLESDSGSYDLGKFHVKFETTDFETINFKSDSIKEQELLKKDSKFVKKEKSKLSLKLDNGKTKVFLSSDDYDSLPFGHRYLGYVPEINKFIIREGGHEWMNDILVDKTTGETLMLEGPMTLSVSPDKKQFVCRIGSGEYNREYFRLYIYSNHSLPKLIINEEEKDSIKNFKFKGVYANISGYECETFEIKWIDNRTVFFKTRKRDIDFPSFPLFYP